MDEAKFEQIRELLQGPINEMVLTSTLDVALLMCKRLGKTPLDCTGLLMILSIARQGTPFDAPQEEPTRDYDRIARRLLTWGEEG